MQKYLPKYLANKSIALPSLLFKKGKNDWNNKPASWPDIRNTVENGHIYLLVDTRYPTGFTATATGGYSVKIDGVDYDDYNSQAQFSMADWTNYTTTEGYQIDYPTGATKAHIIDIYPQRENENITAFQLVNVGDDTTKGSLWVHFNLTNTLVLHTAFQSCALLTAITAKNNTLNVRYMYTTFQNCPLLEYLPVLNASQNGVNADNFLSYCATITSITLKNSDKFNIGRCGPCNNLRTIKADNYLYIDQPNNLLINSPNLKKIPSLQFANNITSGENVFKNDNSLIPFSIDIRNCTSIKKFTCFGENSSAMLNLKSFRVSNQAPFNNTTSPQIDISYTKMDRDALVQLFNDLPNVTDGQIINITGCVGTANLTAEDELIATAKGWTITK